MRWLTLSVAVASLVVPLANLASGQLSGKVVGITDGDILTALVDREPVKVRLAEIDTPQRCPRTGTSSRPVAPPSSNRDGTS